MYLLLARLALDADLLGVDKIPALVELVVDDFKTVLAHKAKVVKAFS